MARELLQSWCVRDERGCCASNTHSGVPVSCLGCKPRNSIRACTSQVDNSNHLLRRVVLASGVVSTIAGNLALGSGPPTNYGQTDGTGTAASFYYPVGVAVDSTGSLALVVRSISEEGAGLDIEL